MHGDNAKDVGTDLKAYECPDCGIFRPDRRPASRCAGMGHGTPVVRWIDIAGVREIADLLDEDAHNQRLSAEANKDVTAVARAGWLAGVAKDLRELVGDARHA